MAPKLPERASDYTFRQDVRYSLDKIRNGSHRHDAYRRTLQSFELPSNLSGAISGFTGRNGEFSFKSQLEYEKFIEAQRVADADGNGTFDSDEYAVFNAIRHQYADPVGGVKLNINNQNIKNIRSIQKQKDGSYKVALGLFDTTSTFTFKPQPEEKKAQIDIPNIGDTVEFRNISTNDYTVNQKSK